MKLCYTNAIKLHLQSKITGILERKERNLQTHQDLSCHDLQGIHRMSRPGVPVKSQINTFLRKEEITGIKIENQKEKIKEDISYSRPAII